MRFRCSYLLLVVAGAMLLAVGCASGAAPAGSGAAPAAPTAAKPAEKAPAPAASGAKYPSQAVEFGCSGDPGGGLDLFNRSVDEGLKKENIFTGTLNITYNATGGGNAAMSSLAERKGNGYVLMSNANRVFLNNMMGTTKLGIDDFTSVARLATDYVMLVVPKDSKFKTAKDFMDAMKKDPKSISIGTGSAPPNDDYLNIIYPAVAAGIDPTQINVVVFKSGGDLNAKLLGGHIDSASTSFSEGLPQLKSGDFRALAISAPQRIKDAPDVPTWKEQGYDVEISHWRGVWGPKDMPKEALDYWVDAFKKMHESATWKQILTRNGWYPEYVAGADFQAALKAEEEKALKILQPLGILPKK